MNKKQSKDLYIEKQSNEEPMFVRIYQSEVSNSELQLLEFIQKGHKFVWRGKHKKIVNGLTSVWNMDNNELVFEGEYSNRIRNGYGIQYQKNKVVYEGEFKNDQYNGWGLRWKAYEKYQGQFRNGLYDGFGKYESSQQIYEGYFRENHNDGFGIKIIGKSLNIPKDKQIIQFLTQLLDREMEGFQQKYHIDQIYVGEWSKGFKSGHGKQWKAKGYWYSGQFSQNLYHGLGALFQSTTLKAVQQGTFKNGKLFAK